MDKRLGKLVERLQAAFGEKLESVVLYGSAAGGDHHAAFSDFNVLCALSEVNPRELAAGEDIFRWWREQGSPSPLLLSVEELTRSTDSFAIEFHDIKAQHVLLYGKDLISDLEVDGPNYRAQVEHELRAKFLRLRQKAGGMLSDSAMLRRLMADSLSTFCVLFRHALILAGEAAPLRKRETLQRAAARFGFDAAPFETLLDIREEKIKPREADAVKLFGPYLEGIRAVIVAVDRLESQEVDR